MNKINSFDPNKRLTIKLLTGVAAGSLALSMPALAVIDSATTISGTRGDIVDCTLVNRADNSRAYLLMRNNTDTEIIVARFDTRLIRFHDTTLNLADAYVEPMVIPPNDRVMVRLNVEAGVRTMPHSGSVVDMKHVTRFLSQGTRVVAISARMINGVGTVVNPLVQA